MCDRKKCVKTVYNGCIDAGTCSMTPEEFEKSIRLFHCTENGGISFNEDTKEAGLWWLNVFCPGELPDKNLLWWLMLVAKKAGCKILATEVPNKINGRIMSMVGFQSLSNGLYGLRLC